MALRLRSGLYQLAQRLRSRNNAQRTTITVPRRGIVLSDNGAVYEKPVRNRFGIIKVLLVTIPFLYLGATAGKEVSAFLEENDIFVPDDDDDD